MKVYNRPDQSQWSELVKRPAIDTTKLSQTVTAILDDVKQNGDSAIFKYASMFDGADLKTLEVTSEEISQACDLVDDELKQAIAIAYGNISAFHEAQQSETAVIETTVGVKCWRKSVAIEKVGLYIPGGSAPLFSTILMLGIPARLAGCEELILCTPSDENGVVNPAILYTANLVGVSKIYKVGGAQAIAAMAYGTESVPQMYKIFGPGNQYVTKAKELVQQAGIAIDMPAGPSEVLVIADESCKPAFVAADLLSQAEHGGDSQVILLAESEAIVAACLSEIDKQLEKLPRKAIAQKALKNSKAIILKDMNECIAFSNHYAPEHLIIASTSAIELTKDIKNAGSVFLGNYSCESAGDYASGTNHTLPTNGFARSYSGVSLDSFVKKITFQELSREGIRNIGQAIEVMAEAEELIAHKNAVSIRLKAIEEA